MANDMQWPSEDEDFDAKTDSASIKSFSNKPEKLVPIPAPKPANKVSVAVSEPDAHQSQELDEVEQAFAEPVQAREAIAQEQPAKPKTEVASVPVTAVVDEIAPQDSATNNDQAAHVSEPEPKTKRDGNVLRTLFEIVLVLALIGVGYYAYTLYNDKQDLATKVTTLSANPQIAIQKQTDELITKVGSLIQLPTGETPTVANVSDAAKAKQQSSFFANAVNGDKVLMYVKAGQAILYRPSTDKIVLVAPLTFNADAAKPAATNATTTPAKR